MVRVLEEKQALMTEILEAIMHFKKRQHLVVQVMQDLDIDIEDVGKWGAVIWSQQGTQKPLSPLPESTTGSVKELWDATRRARLKNRVPQQGTWGNSGEWQYFLHGKGCRLSNTLTGEVIDWNCPNVDAFDPFSFLEHLSWRLKVESKENLPLIRQYVAQSPDEIQSIVLVIKQMREKRLINSDWTLPKTTSP